MPDSLAKSRLADCRHLRQPSAMSESIPPAAIQSAAECLWHYHRLAEPLDRADGILVFGSNDLRVANHAATLYLAGYAPWILISGGRGRMTQHWPTSEAEAMGRVVLAAGVPEDAVLLECRATNTGENIRFARDLLEAANRDLRRGIFVQKPYMERRTRAALEVQWPGIRIHLSSPPLDFSSYCEDIDRDLVITAMVGDFQRILDYPALGYASPQPVPARVRAAFGLLVAAGYRAHLA